MTAEGLQESLPFTKQQHDHFCTGLGSCVYGCLSIACNALFAAMPCAGDAGFRKNVVTVETVRESDKG